MSPRITIHAARIGIGAASCNPSWARSEPTADRRSYEPMPVRGNPMFGYPANDRAEYFLQAIANAKLAGAAAWCFYTGSDADDFRTGPPFPYHLYHKGDANQTDCSADSKPLLRLAAQTPDPRRARPITWMLPPTRFKQLLRGSQDVSNGHPRPQVSAAFSTADPARRVSGMDEAVQVVRVC